MTELEAQTEAGLPLQEGGPASGISSKVCTHCGEKPAPSNSSWCRDCRNEQAAEYRERTRPRPTTEERVCALDGCDGTFIWRSTHPKQICCSKAHYNKHRYWQDREPELRGPADGQIFCSKCERWRPISEFSPSRQHLRRSWCRDCSAEHGREWDAANKERRSAATRRSRSARLLRKYDAYTDNIGQIAIDQGDVCYLCGCPPGVKGFHIDHDHELEELGLPSFRGLACSACNVGAGAFEDDPDRMERVAAKLRCRKAELRRMVGG